MSSEAQAVLQEKSSNLTCCGRIKALLKPVIDIKRDPNTKILTFKVVPESIRAWFYIYFWIFALTGVIITNAAKSTNLSNNPILNTFGNNNICVFFDDPPFSYFAAAYYFPLQLLGILYLWFDWQRVKYYYLSNKFPRLTNCFYNVYVLFACIIGLSIAVFVQVFGTQPEQSMPGHFLPFLFLMISMWFLSFFHFLFFLRIEIINKKELKYYVVGIIYLILMGITVIIKATLDLTNLAGAKLWTKPGAAFTKPLSEINDAFFMIFMSICPLFIYLVFVDELDHVQITLNVTASFQKQVDDAQENYDKAVDKENDNINNENDEQL